MTYQKPPRPHEEPLEATLTFREKADGRKLARLPSGRIVLVATHHAARVTSGERWRVRLQHLETASIAELIHRERPELTNPVIPAELSSLLLGRSEAPDVGEDQTELVQQRPSERLIEILGRSPEPLRVGWRPGGLILEHQQLQDFLSTVRGVWARFRLERHSSVGGRRGVMLRGTVTPTEMSDGERVSLLQVFDVGLLNRFVADTARRDAAEVFELIRVLAPLPLAPEVRITVWSFMLTQLSETELRYELHLAAPYLHPSDPSLEPGWTKPLFGALHRAAARTNDEDIKRLLQEAEADTPLSIAALTDWAKRLEFPTATLPAADASIALPGVEGAKETTRAELPANVDAESAAALVERWTISLRLANQNVEGLLADAHAASARLAAESELLSLDAFRRLFRQLELVREATVQCLHVFPSPAELINDVDEAQAAYELLEEQIGEQAAVLLSQCLHLRPDDVVAIAATLSRAEVLPLVPAAAWSNEETSGIPKDLSERFHRLVDPRIRAQVIAACSGLEEFPAVPREAISEIDAALTAFDETEFRDALRRRSEGVLRLRDVPQNQRIWVDQAAAMAANDDAVFRLVRRLESLESSLSIATFAGILKAVECTSEIADREQTVRRYEEAVDFVESIFRTAKDATIGQLNEWLAQQDAKGSRRTDQDIAPSFELSISHNVMDAVNRRAPLTLVKHEDPNVPYGFVAAPIVIEASKLRDYELSVDVTVVGRGRVGWLKTYDKPVPETLTIRDRDWRQIGNEKLLYTFELQLPVRLDELNRNAEFQIDMALFDLGTRKRLSAEKRLAWKSPEVFSDKIILDWPPNVINPEFVRAHPVGPQKKFSQIEARLLAGGSFAALAPRRFGKTTLLEFIRSRADTIRMVCPESIACTSFPGSSGVDYDAIWRALSDQLQHILGGPTLQGPIIEGLPGPKAFDYVRREAARMGYRAILLLFDEAQLLFPKVGGYQLGDRWKDLIERHWSRPDATEMAPVLFGFVGLLSLPERAGINFTNFLEPEEGHELNEADLNKILLSVTANGLHTTKEARQHLTVVAPNLYLTRTLVGSLVDMVNSKGRRWISYNDVSDVENQIIAGLKLGREDRVGGLVRDALNDAPSVNIWRPSTLFPVALALALARNEGLRGEHRLADRILALVNEWCADVEVGLSTRLEYTAAMIQRDMDALGEYGIFDRGEFTSAFLEAWLVGEGRSGYPINARAALLRGASLRVRVPDGLTPLDEGGQARIFRFTRDGVRYALRRVELEDEQARTRFLENANTLRILAEGLVRREAGSEYLFELDSVGFSDQDDMVGLQIYRWIDGHNLQVKVGQLPTALVAEIGYKMALALRLLEKFGVLHRDVCPRNIVFSEIEKHPVLIDFGLARLETEALRTIVTSAYSAPEVQSTNPKWTRAADIYALGATLRALLAPADPQAGILDSLLDACMATEPSERPDSTELARRLEGLRSRLHVEDQRTTIWSQISEVIGADGGKRWFWQVVEKFRPTFQILGLGFHDEEFDRSAELAAFLDQVLEAVPRPRGGTHLKLGYVKNRNDDTGETFVGPAFEFLHQLRLYTSHGDVKRSKANTLQRLGYPSTVEMKLYVQEGAERIGRFLDLPSLAQVIAVVQSSQAGSSASLGV